jgi:tRNA A-37 threonylcarbamoyl transferase component Bud32
MAETRCPEEHDLLPLIAGDVAADALRGHLDSCPRCQRLLQRLRAEVMALRKSWPDGLPPIDAAPPPTGVSEGKGTAASKAATGSSDQTVDGPPLGQGSPPPPPGERPSTIGKYVIVSALDEGGQALVYRALHPTLYKQLVIKLSRLPLGRDLAEHAQLVNEGQILADLDHPNLARVYDLDFHENCPFLVIEYVRGRNLEQYARQVRPTPRQTALLVAAVARALAVAHRRGIIHQDVKPRNIMIDEAGQPRLLDFGLARLCHAWAGDAVPSDSISGTPTYMAPEQARGETGRIDQRSDLFALGGVLYYLLTGKAPFTGRTIAEILGRAGRCDFDKVALRAAGVPRRLEAICLQALAAEPEDRYATAESLVKDLEEFARRPNRLLQLAGVGVLVLALIGAGWWLFSPAPPVFPGDPQYLITLVQRQVHGEDQLFGDLKNALPMRSGDKLQIHCDLPRGYRAALFWLDTEGKLTELPAKVSSATTLDQLVYPQGGVVSLQGPPGTELVLVCAHRSQVPRREHVANLLDAGRPWPKLPAQVVILLDRDKVDLKVPRGLGAESEATAVSQVQERLEELRVRLREHFDYFAGVAFSHVESHP